MADDLLLPDGWAEAWATRSAADFMWWMSDQGVTAPHVRLLGYEVDRYGSGDCVLSWQVPRPLLNPANIAHGGFLAAITAPDGRLLARACDVFQPNRRLVPRDLWEDAGLT